MAFALFPTVAGAESSSEIQYRDAPPTVTGKTTGGPPATSSDSDGGSRQSSTGSGSATDGAPDGTAEDDSQEGAGAVAGKGGDGKGGAAKGSDRERESALPEAATPLDTEQTSSDDGSSPLVPILIAVAVLAAISIGAVAWRRRHGGGADSGAGSPVSPEAS